MKVVEHIYAIKNLLAKGPQTIDFSYSDRLIYHYLKIARAKLIEQKADKYKILGEQSYQNLCVELEKAPFHECCGVTVQPDCLLFKSKNPIPKFLNARWGSLMHVLTLDGITIPEFNLVQKKYSEFASVPTDKTIGWFYHDNHLYLVNNVLLTFVLLNGLFDDPTEVNTINCTSTQSTLDCDYLQEIFPIDIDLVEPMYRIVLDIFTKLLNIPKDTENNALDGAETP